MIQLYTKDNTDYDHNGTTLHPTSCILTQEINSTHVIELDHPIDSNGVYKNIVEGAVIAVPTPTSDKQLFRIYEKSKSDDGVVAYARPIFYDAAHDTMLIDTRPTNKTGQQALDILCDGTVYSGESDITDISTAYIEYTNLVEALLSDADNSFINRWGGEAIFDNYKIIINTRAGGDYGVRVTFGYNMNSIEEDVNMDDVVTRIYPKAYNGYTLADNGYVDSPNIDKYPIVYAKVIEYTDLKLTEDCTGDETGYDTLDELREALIEQCNAEFDDGIDVPEITYTISMVDLANTIEYKDYAVLESVGLGDTVTCKNSRLDITTSARAVKLEWDCILKKNNSVELGDASSNYFDQLSSVAQTTTSVLNSDGTVNGASISGVIDAMQAVLKASRGVAQKQQARAILFEDTDPDSDTFGATAIGTTGFCISDTRTADDKDWVWSTIGTGKGFLADMLIGGLLVSQNYDETLKQGVKWDLNTGLLKAFQFAWDATYSSLSEDGKLSLKSLELVMEDADATQAIIHCTCGEYEFTVYPDTIDFANSTEYLHINSELMAGGTISDGTRTQNFALSPSAGYSGKISGVSGVTGMFMTKDSKRVDVVNGIITAITASE